MPNAPPTSVDIFGQTQQRASSAIPNLLDEELSSILGTDSNIVNTQTSIPMNPSTGNLLDDIFGDLNLTTGGASAFSYSATTTFALPKEVR
jgi:hypothetical protein